MVQTRVDVLHRTNGVVDFIWKGKCSWYISTRAIQYIVNPLFPDLIMVWHLFPILQPDSVLWWRIKKTGKFWMNCAWSVVTLLGILYPEFRIGFFKVKVGRGIILFSSPGLEPIPTSVVLTSIFECPPAYVEGNRLEEGGFKADLI